MKVGYRSERIIKLAEDFHSKEVCFEILLALYRLLPITKLLERDAQLDIEWFENPDIDINTLRAKILSLYGFGPYATSNVLQLMGRSKGTLLLSSSDSHSLKRLS